MRLFSRRGLKVYFFFLCVCVCIQTNAISISGVMLLFVARNRPRGESEQPLHQFTVTVEGLFLLLPLPTLSSSPPHIPLTCLHLLPIVSFVVNLF